MFILGFLLWREIRDLGGETEKSTIVVQVHKSLFDWICKIVPFPIPADSFNNFYGQNEPNTVALCMEIFKQLTTCSD